MSLDVDIDDDPLDALRRWYREADAAMPSDEAHAIAFASIGDGGMPAVRVVLVRAIRDDGGMDFYTNYHSRKGRELDANPACAAVFHWRPLRRQCRVEGRASRCTPQESDAYWAGRPRESRLSALVSPQSQDVESFEALERAKSDLRQKYAEREIERPAWWGGYVLTPSAVEFWAEGDARLHERIRFERTPTGWNTRRLGP